MEHQGKDIGIGPLKLYLKSGNDVYLKVFDIREERAIKKDTDKGAYRINTDGIITYKDKYMVPAKLIFGLIYHYHVELGHMMKDIVLDKVQQWFYYKNMDLYVTGVMQGCEEY